MVGSILRRSVLLGAVAVGLSGAAAAAETTLGGALTATATTSTAAPVEASGSFEAIVDFGSLTLVDVPIGCRLTVDGTLRFYGALVGDAVGTTTALVFAPCAAVATQRPGAFADIFRFEGSFTGTIAGEPVTAARLSYAGVTYAGGDIDAVMRVDGPVPVVARADAVVAEGGTYTGVVLT